MAGHSKWANIKFKKAAQDAKRGKLFTKLIREITVASRMGGADPGANPRLRVAIDKALNANMQKDVIERAIKKGSGELESQDLVEIRYEGYGPSGVAILVDCLSDNKNRTAAEVRHAFSKYNGNLGTDGSVAYLFNMLGSIILEDTSKEEEIMDIALNAGAEDIVIKNDSIEVITNPKDFSTIKEALEKKNLSISQAEVTMLPDNLISLDKEQAEKFITLVDALEDLDDVQNVYSNADIDEDILQEIM